MGIQKNGVEQSVERLDCRCGGNRTSQSTNSPHPLPAKDSFLPPVGRNLCRPHLSGPMLSIFQPGTGIISVWSNGTVCRRSRCDASSPPAGGRAPQSLSAGRAAWRRTFIAQAFNQDHFVTPASAASAQPRSSRHHDRRAGRRTTATLCEMNRWVNPRRCCSGAELCRPLAASIQRARIVMAMLRQILVQLILGLQLVPS